MEFVGLAHVPRRIGEVLTAAASSASLAGAELYALSRAAGDVARLAEVVSDARRNSDEAVQEAAQMLGGGLDRDDVIAIAQCLRVMTDRIEEAASAILRLSPEPSSWDSLAGVQRDLAREVATLVAQLDGRPNAADARFERVESLYQEGKRLLRASRARLVAQDDVLVALAGNSALDHIERAIIASRHGARTVRRVLVKHA